MVDCESLRKILNNKIEDEDSYINLINSVRPIFRQPIKDQRDEEIRIGGELSAFGYTQGCLSPEDMKSLTKKFKI